jgi:putative inorganic carbon (HCO3(-)) transporter
VQLCRLRQSANVQGFWLMGALATLLGMLAHGTVDTIWFRPEVNTLWWLMVALIASYWTPSLTDNQASNLPNAEPTSY